MARPVGRPGETRERAVRAALELFAEHGVSGTSLQMIANHLKITKAAVYHQFATKDEIVLAVLQPAIDLIWAVVEKAEAETSRSGQVEVTLDGLVEMIIQNRQLATVLAGDPAVAAVIRSNPTLLSLTPRLDALLNGPDPDPATRVAVAMTTAGLFVLPANPALADLDDDTLKAEMLSCATKILRVGERARAGGPQPGRDEPAAS